jgi:L-lactate permease
MWQQVYDPFGNSAMSTIAAAVPVATLLVLIATGAVKTHLAALIALLVAIVIAVLLFTMPAGLAIRASILGAVIGFFPIGWIVLNVIFMYRLTVATGAFGTLQQAIGAVTPDRRLQVLLISFAFGAFFEGASGFGTPVAVTAAILIGLGFSPLAASGLSLIANTAPVAYGALGTPIVARQCHRARPLSARRNDRAPITVLLVDCTGLGDLRLYGLARNGPDLARNPCLRRVLCDPPIFNFEFYQSVDRRYRGFADLHGGPNRVSKDLAATRAMDLAGVTPPR